MPAPLKSELEGIRKMSDADIELAARQDHDAPPISDQDLAKARYVRLDEYLPTCKEKVCLRLDRDVLDWFRQGGSAGYQTKINAALKAYIAAHEGEGQL
jgi:uncharacterized protein (DUF4415 family)